MRRSFWKTVGACGYGWAKAVFTVRHSIFAADVPCSHKTPIFCWMHWIERSAPSESLSVMTLVENSHSTHARPKLDAIYAAEEVRPIVGFGRTDPHNSDTCWLTVVAG